MQAFPEWTLDGARATDYNQSLKEGLGVDLRRLLGRSLRVTLVGVGVMVVLLAPFSQAASGPQNNGIFGAPAAAVQEATIQSGFQEEIVFSGLDRPSPSASPKTDGCSSPRRAV